MKHLGTGIWFIGCLCLGLTAWSAEEGLILSTKEDNYFKKEAPTGSAYVHFRTNGTYRRIAREHMYVAENDRGTWIQDSTGLVTMKSAMHYRNIEARPLAIWTWHTNTAARLPQIHEAISAFLRTNNSEHFESDFIRNRLVQLPSRGTNVYSPISPDPRENQTSRSNLVALLAAIEVFTNRTDNHHFHVTPMKYKEIRFLLWGDAETPINRDLPAIKNSIDQLQREEGRKDLVPYVYTGIDKKRFDDEAGRTQEFLFRPEMNPLRKEPASGQQ